MGMTSLYRRRINAAVILMYDILNGNADCPLIKANLETNGNIRNLRRNEYLKVIDKGMRLALTSPVLLMCNHANLVADQLANSATRANFISTVRNTLDSTFEIATKL